MLFFKNECKCRRLEGGVGRGGRRWLSWKTGDQHDRVTGVCISVRDWLDSAGAPWQRLLGYFASGTTGKDGRANTCTRAGDLSSGLLAGLGNTVRLGGGGGLEERREPVVRCLCAAQAAIWLEAGTGPWKRLVVPRRQLSREQSRVFGAVLSCSVNQVSKTMGEAVAVADIHGHPHPMPSRRLGETALVQYQ